MPDFVSTPERPDGWSIIWPYPGPYPPGYEPPEELSSVPAASDDNPPEEPPDKIEQDWEITLNTPDPTINSPQIYAYISPINGSTSLYAFLLLNYSDTPEYVAGGMQFQLWDGEEIVSTQEFASGFQLNTIGEIITFTLRMEIQDRILNPDELNFSVHYGESDTWGSFGTGGFDLGDDAPILSGIFPIEDLSTYRTSKSVSASAVGFGGQRVDLMRITQVRYYKDDVLIGQDDSEHIVHQWL